MVPVKLSIRLLLDEYYSRRGEERKRYYFFLRSNRNHPAYLAALRQIGTNARGV
jgi:hypothetical protein